MGLGHQRTRRKLQEKMDATGKRIDESKRPTEPTASERKDPVLMSCRLANEIAQRTKANSDYRARDQLYSDAERAGKSLRAIARMTGMTHRGVSNIIHAHRERI